MAVVHCAAGRAAELAQSASRLDGEVVEVINSRLRPKPERPEPRTLRSNVGYSFLGFKPYGEGFVLSPEERALFIASDHRNTDVIFPYLGGEEINSRPDQGFNRYVIFFDDMTEAEARRWPLLMTRVEELVKPDRLSKSRDVAQWPWWQFWRTRPELRSSLAGLSRCLVTSRITKHLCFSFQPTNRMLNEQVYLFPLAAFSELSVLQSRIHEAWVRLLSSTLEERLNYSATDCFETFPFPHPDPRTVIPSLEDIGQRLYDTRAQYMLDTQRGLTDTYNRLKDPACHEPRIEELRQLHEEMDRAVLAAYAWDDIPVPPYTTPATDAERRALEAFEDEVIDRLFVLNAQRAEEEKRQAASATGKAAPKKGRGRKAKEDGGQRSLLE